MADVKIDFHLLRLNGDPEMTNGVGEYSYTPPPDLNLRIHALNVLIVKNGQINPANYGGAALTNGITLHVHSSTEHFDVLAEPIKIIPDWFLYAGEKIVIQAVTGTRTLISMHLAIRESDQILVLQGARGDTLTLHIDDLLTGIFSQRVMLQCSPI